jgi:hypothetical protein
LTGQPETGQQGQAGWTLGSQRQSCKDKRTGQDSQLQGNKDKQAGYWAGQPSIGKKGTRRLDRAVRDRAQSQAGWILGFNVSNLMGITRRMIDICKKITFYFLQNV